MQMNSRSMCVGLDTWLAICEDVSQLVTSGIWSVESRVGSVEPGVCILWCGVCSLESGGELSSAAVIQFRRAHPLKTRFEHQLTANQTRDNISTKISFSILFKKYRCANNI